jgi:hypothetical protein
MNQICSTTSEVKTIIFPGKMQFPNYFYQITLEELYGQVMFSNTVTRTDRQIIKAALLKEALSENEHDIINRLIYNVRRGWVRVVD